MIGAALPAAPPVTPQAPPAEAAATTPSNATPPSSTKPGATAAKPANEATQPANADAAEPAGDFDALLASNAPAEPVVASATVETDLPVATTDTTDATASTPDQLLQLLAGSQAIAAAPQPPAAPTVPATPAPTRGNAMRDANIATAFPLPAAPAPATTAAPASAPIELPLATLADANQPSAATADTTPNFDTLLSTPAASAPTVQTATTSAPAVALAAPLAFPTDPEAGFDDGLGARIAWLADQSIGQAEIRIHPEHLGPIEVRIQVDGTRVNTEFHSAHAEVRHALEQSVPRLRDLLGQHGLQLGQADVGQRQQGGAQQAPRDFGATDAQGETAATTTPPPRVRVRGLLDEYA